LPVTDRRRRAFPGAFEREAVARVRPNEMTVVAGAERLGPHETVLRRWIAL
jgi:transposase-like protein